jgi:serine/threonine-protein kinase
MEPKQFGSCRVTSALASGHVTEVFRALQHPLGRDVAIKALKPSIAPSSPFALSLEREARILSNLRHENIARILDYGRDDHVMWFAVEFVEGLTLRQLLAQVKSVDVPCAVAIAVELARALAHAHARGVIHCDVRPSNILVGRDGQVVLIDFGSAYAENMPSSPEPLDVDAALAAPSYMSPEQILGETVDPRSDVFAVGVVIYELLSGRRPFEGKDDRTLAHSVRHDEPKSLDRSTTPRALGQIVARCLQKLPGDRFASARELCTALEGAYGNLSSSPRRHVITATLARARIIDRPAHVDEDHPDLLGPSSEGPSVVPALRMLFVMLALLVFGGTAIHFVFRTDIEARAASGQGALLLVPCSFSLNPGLTSSSTALRSRRLPLPGPSRCPRESTTSHSATLTPPTNAVPFKSAPASASCSMSRCRCEGPPNRTFPPRSPCLPRRRPDSRPRVARAIVGKAKSDRILVRVVVAEFLALALLDERALLAEAVGASHVLASLFAGVVA